MHLRGGPGWQLVLSATRCMHALAARRAESIFLEPYEPHRISVLSVYGSAGPRKTCVISSTISTENDISSGSFNYPSGARGLNDWRE